MSELSHYIKLRSSLSGCNTKQFECDKYLDCDSCLEDKIKEHDMQVKADAIEELVDGICCHSAFTNMQKVAIRTYAEQLKSK